jgi:hypothetical protein
LRRFTPSATISYGSTRKIRHETDLRTPKIKPSGSGFGPRYLRRVRKRLGFARAAGSLSSAEARLLLQRVFGAELKSDQIRIKSIKPGAAGENVIVEAQIETAFRFTRVGRDWRIAEVRLGDRQWESMDLIDEASSGRGAQDGGSSREGG